MMILLSFFRTYWKWIAAALAVVFFYMVAYERGSSHVQKLWDAQKIRDAKDIAKLVEKQTVVTTQVVTQYVDRVQVVHEKAQVITKEVPVYVTQADDARCTINNGFVSVWNAANANAPLPATANGINEAASGVKLSDVATQHSNEAEYVHQLEEQLTALQAWVKAQQEAANAAQASR